MKKPWLLKIFKRIPYANNSVFSFQNIFIMGIASGYFYIILAFAKASPLHEAIYRGDSVDSLRSLIRTNNVNERNEANLCTLHVAVVANNYKACELLLDSGADIEREDDSGATALIYAVVGNQAHIVKLLCRKGANVEHAMGPERRTALHIAAQRNHVQVFETLMYHGEDVDLNVLDVGRSTPFMLAAEKGHVDILNLHSLIETRVIMNDVNGQTALIRAVIAGQLNSVLKILYFIIRSNEKDLTGAAAVHYAARFGHKQILVALLESCDMEIKDDDGNTPLMYAAFVASNELESHLANCHRSAEIIKILLLKKANFQTVNNAGHNAADLALHSKNYEALTILIKEAAYRSSPNGLNTVFPALHCAILNSNIRDIRNLLLTEDINKKDYLDQTATHMAVRMSSEKIVRLLVDAGCNITAKDAWSNTPLHLVKTAEIALILLKANPETANIPNIMNRLPLHYACEFERLNVVQVLAPATADIHAKTDRGLTALSTAALKGNIPICRCLLQHGAGFNLPLNTATPLHWAVRRNFTDLCLLFLNWGLKADAVDEKFDTAAQYAVGVTGNIEVIRILLEHTPIDVSNRAGYTLLHTAAVSRSTNRMDLVRLLLEFGVSINAQTFNGKTALYLATLQNHPEVVKVLLKYGADTRITCKGQTALHVAIAQSPKCAKMLVDADPHLINVSGNRCAKPVDFLISQLRRGISLEKLKEVKELAEAMSLLGLDVPETSLRKWMPSLSISFAKYLHRLEAPITFDQYIQRGVTLFTKDYKLQGESDMVIAYLNHGMGTFYSFAAAYYPNLALGKAPRSDYELAHIREGYRQAVLAYEKKRGKAFYVKMLRFMITESFLRKREHMFKGTYMDFLPQELIEDVIIGAVNRGNVLGRIELVANALMLALTDRLQVEPYRRLLGCRMYRLSKLIFPAVRRTSFSLKRKKMA